MSSSVIEFQQVVKEYPSDWLGRRKLRALDQVTLAIPAGVAFGLVGPNRAGKTTFVKTLLSLSRPTSGAVTRFGIPARQRRTLARVGYVHENQAFPRYLTARQLLEYYGALSLLPQHVVKTRAPELLERVGLADRAHEPVSRFSKGMIQRLGIAQALINDPELLVMDEPSEGLDLMGRQLVRDIVAQMKARGRTVLFVSHVLPEVEALVEHLAILRAGRLVYHGTVAEVKRNAEGGERSFEQALNELYLPTVGKAS